MTPTGPCSLTPEALEERLHAWRTLSGALLAGQRTATGAVLRYRLDPEVVETLLELIEAERRCCPSLSFTASVAVLVDAPEIMHPWLTAMLLGGSGETQATTGREVARIDRQAEGVRGSDAAPREARRRTARSGGPQCTNTSEG